MGLIAIALTAIAGIGLLIGLLVLVPRKPGYSHLQNTISELGENGAPDPQVVNYGLFLLVGILMLCVAALVFIVSPVTAVLALCIAVGYLVAVVFPCVPGSPLSG